MADLTRPPSARAALSRLVMELAAAALFFGFGAVVLAGAAEHEIGWGEAGPQAGYFPFWLGLFVMAGSLVTGAQALAARDVLRREAFLSRDAGRCVLRFAPPVLALVPLALLLGLYVGMAIFLASMLRWQGRHGWGIALAVALAAPLFCFLVFERWFLVPLLKGPLETILGIG